MNIQKKINKLLFALSQKGKVYQVNTFKFFSSETNRYHTKFTISRKAKGKVTEKIECYSPIEVLKHLVDELKEGG